MKLWWVFAVGLLAVSLSGAHAQLAIGPGGIRTPPINLISIFKFIRDIVMAYLYPPEPGSELKVKPQDQKLIPVRDDENSSSSSSSNSASSGALKQHVNVMGFDTEGNIVEKFDSGCVGDSTVECITYNAEGDASGDGPLDRIVADVPEDGEVEDKDGTMQLVVGKWPIAYITLISILFWLFVIIASPYILTGETINRRREDDYSTNSLVDQQDLLLLLSWLLGEVSEDTSCLERVVCLTPTKSSRYISVSSMVFNVASYLRSWVPYSKRFDDRLRRLEDVTLDGFSQECHNYYCPTIPEL